MLTLNEQIIKKYEWDYNFIQNHKILINSQVTVCWHDNISMLVDFFERHSLSSLSFRRTLISGRQLASCGKSNWQYHLFEREVSQESDGMCLLNSQLIANFQLQLLFGSIIFFVQYLSLLLIHTQTKNPIQEQSVIHFFSFFSRKYM